MSELSGTSSYDSKELRPIKQMHEGIELPWEEQEQRYCGHISQRWIRIMGNGKENTPVGFLWLIGITDYLKKGLLKELDAEDMAEFIKASTEIRYYKAGADPKFWNEFDEETRSAAINELRQNQCFQELEIMRSAVDMLDSPQEIIQPAQV